MQTFSIGRHLISQERPPLFLAEVGAFFSQDLDLARKLLDTISDARSSVPEQPLAFKTEILHDPEICLPGNTEETYMSKDGRIKKENYRQLIERKIFPLSKYEILLNHCRDLDFDFVVSVYDFVGVDFAVSCDAAAIKIASGNIVHIPLLRYAAKTKLPLIIDTGRASLGEVERAIEVIAACGCQKVVIEHSPDGHPAAPKAHNMRMLRTYLDTFELPVGLSDHHIGHEMLYLGVGLGASVLEKGVHFNPGDLDIDLSHSMCITDLPDVLRKVVDCWVALGDPRRKADTQISGVIGTSQRAGLIAREDLLPGQKISVETVGFAFPALGISVACWDDVLGLSLKHGIPKGVPITWSDINLAHQG